MNQLEKICVFCGSSEGNDLAITQMAQHLGKTLSEQKITLVYGAAKIGVMGVLAASVLEHHGQVVGIIPGFLKKKEVVHLGLSQLITTENMHERKLRMQQESDGFIALPGGMGTLEELFEILTWLQLGLHNKPVGILNVNHFFDDLLQMMENMVRKGFLSIENYELLLVSDSIDALLEKMREFRSPRIPKWLSPERA
ncbi:MAG TPA: TIGR00730 family Rossman fold protein [Flavobacteriaceae bacterium]|nr:TIGR00730 family Rossman fold protein [Flavobacteriaceae bacterium]MCB9214156.1 TIGR00730 family Rossman fold protein [Alteromonas sp.]HPF11941.1 TIGR00730 family Rossman fold protein [Flavobacteriaceae bacterium]HQU22615.1 TIGR00730 family Rossman fold protein [Flavobacteriaceae bacterium]HQU65427.1 TIGR00730 family Rossman fold protein [Flavobacteriaceae bacterium]